jgi:predicted metal-dependent HD superfamily phosphohydrolase
VKGWQATAQRLHRKWQAQPGFWFFEKYEDQARINIQASLRRLTGT